jgi:hypothetical protein
MPEEPEVEMEKLHEAIQEELEQEGGSFLRRIALTTALFGVGAAGLFCAEKILLLQAHSVECRPTPFIVDIA